MGKGLDREKGPRCRYGKGKAQRRSIVPADVSGLILCYFFFSRFGGLPVNKCDEFLVV